ncbi:MAG: DUF2141 domain-containing protein [Pseudomonadota bacterium]
MTPDRIKTAARFLSIASLQIAILATLPLDAARAEDAASLTVSFTGIQTPDGYLMVGLYDSEESFNARAAVRGVRVPVAGAEAAASIPDLKPGRYGIMAFHDLDGDGTMATNPFGMPAEPYAASNNAPSMMGPPTWNDAAFEVTAGSNVQTITIE